MLPEILIRRAETRDAINLAALAIQVWLDTYATDGIRGSISKYVLTEFTPEKFEDYIESPSHLLFVAEKSEHILGYAMIAFDIPCLDRPDLDVHLVTLYIQERSKRKGIGSELLTAGLEEAKRRTLRRQLWLTVNSLNKGALDFYAARGFQQIGTTLFQLDGELHGNNVLGTSPP
jgi:ribosomal protein S18 acetylase RimI-like enzyme